ncbi:MAG TPA: pilus assembly protein PilM [Solirubrobacteraceae bacterium]
MKLPALSAPNLKLGLSIGRRAGADVVGLDIQPGFVAAVKARVNGSIVAEKAGVMVLPADTMRDGEVVDETALADALRELFARNALGKRVRVGVANQRTVLRTLELPPVTDAKELSAAVTFQAQDQVPMPLNNAVLDFHPLGVIDTPAGPRQRVVLVAAQRDMVEKLLSAVRAAGLTPEGVDLSAFALIRSLYRYDPEQTGRVLYLNVDGLSNLAIAEGTVCRFTRVVGSGLEGIASDLAERRGIALIDARTRLLESDLLAPEPVSEPFVPHDSAAAGAEEASTHVPEAGIEAESAPAAFHTEEIPEPEPIDLSAEAQTAVPSLAEHEAYEQEMSYEEMTATPLPAEVPASAVSESDVRMVLENGIREISGEVRNSLDFHRSQEGGGDVSHVVLSGAAQTIPGFAEMLQSSLGVDVRPATVGFLDSIGQVSPQRLAVATGLAASEVPHQ